MPPGVTLHTKARRGFSSAVVAAVLAFANMERLMDVTHGVDDELESERLFLARCVRIAHGLRDPRQRTQRTAIVW